MLIKRRHIWDVPASRVTPDRVFLSRRSFMGAAAGALALAAARPARAAEDPSAGLYPAKLNPSFADAGRPVTEAEYTTTFNNYYEFGSSKRIAAAAEKLPIRPWEVVFDGEIEKPFTIGIDEPEVKASDSSTNPTSSLDQITSSSPRRERCTPSVAAKCR